MAETELLSHLAGGQSVHRLIFNGFSFKPFMSRTAAQREFVLGIAVRGLRAWIALITGTPKAQASSTPFNSLLCPVCPPPPLGYI